MHEAPLLHGAEHREIGEGHAVEMFEAADMVEMEMRRQGGDREMCQALSDGPDIALAGAGIEHQRGCFAGDEITPVQLMVLGLADGEDVR